MQRPYARIDRAENGFMVSIYDSAGLLKEYVATNTWGLYEILKNWTEAPDQEPDTITMKPENVMPFFSNSIRKD